MGDALLPTLGVSSSYCWLKVWKKYTYMWTLGLEDASAQVLRI